MWKYRAARYFTEYYKNSSFISHMNQLKSCTTLESKWCFFLIFCFPVNIDIEVAEVSTKHWQYVLIASLCTCFTIFNWNPAVLEGGSDKKSWHGAFLSFECFALVVGSTLKRNIFCICNIIETVQNVIYWRTRLSYAHLTFQQDGDQTYLSHRLCSTCKFWYEIPNITLFDKHRVINKSVLYVLG